MVGDIHSMCSSHDSFDTSATCRTNCFDHQLQIDKHDCDGMSCSHGSINHARVGSTNNRLSLEAIRQDELKVHAIENALNQFILQAGNIYKGKQLSALDANRLRDAANEAGLSIKVVDALLEQTSDQNAILDYCLTSDDIFAKKIKEHPHLSRVLLENEKDDPEKGNDGLNVSNSIWRIFVHKIIKQFLKEQNMQLTDIIERSSHTRRLYDEALGCDSEDKNKFNTLKLPRDYSEERKHVFITEAEAKQARMQASEAMSMFQQNGNAFMHGQFNGASVQSLREFPILRPQNIGDTPDSRDDGLSMVPCATERESSIVERIKLNEPKNLNLDVRDRQDVVPIVRGASLRRHRELPTLTPQNIIDIPDSRDDNLSMVPCATERESLFIEWAKLNEPTNSSLDVIYDPDGILYATELNITSSRKEPFLQTINDSNKTSSKMPLETEVSPSVKEIDQEINNNKSTSPPCTPKREISPSLTKISQLTTTTNTAGRNKPSVVKRRIAMYEKGSTDPQPKKESPRMKNERLEQDPSPSGNISQARAVFEKKGQLPKTVIEPNRKRQSKNIQHILATWTQKELKSLRTISQKEAKNNCIEVKSVQTEKNYISKKCFRASQNQDFVVEDVNDLEICMQTRQNCRRDLVQGDKTPSFGERSAYQTKVPGEKKDLEIGIEQPFLNDTRDSEFKLKEKSENKSNQTTLHIMVCDSNDGPNNDNEKGLCSDYVLKSMAFPLDQNLKLDTDQETEPPANNQLNYDRPHYVDGNSEDHQREGSSNTNMSISQVTRCHSHTQNSNELMFLPSVKDDRESPSAAFQNIIDAQNSQYFEASRNKISNEMLFPPSVKNYKESPGGAFHKVINAKNGQFLEAHHTKNSNELMFLPLVKDDRESLSGESHKIINARNDQYLEVLFVNNFFQHEQFDFNQSQTLVVDNDLCGSLVCASSASDDSKIPISSFQSPPRVGSVREQNNVTTFLSESSNHHQCTKVGKCGRVSSHAVSEGTFDSTELSDENSSVKSKPNYRFRDQSRGYLKLQQNADHNYMIESEKNDETWERKIEYIKGKTYSKKSSHTVFECTFGSTELSDENSSAKSVSNNSLHDQSHEYLQLQHNAGHNHMFESERNDDAWRRKVEYAKEKECGEISSHCVFEGTFDSGELSYENMSNNKLRDQSHEHLRLEHNIGHNHIIESEKYDRVLLGKVESVEISNYSLKQNLVDDNSWANFESKNMFHQEAQKSSQHCDIPNNMKVIVNTRHNTPKRAHTIEVSNEFLSNDSVDHKISVATKGGVDKFCSNLHSAKKSNCVKDTPALGFTANTSQINSHACDDTKSARFITDLYSRLYYKEKSNTESMPNQKIESSTSFVENNINQSDQDFLIVIGNDEVSRFPIVAHGISSENNSQSEINENHNEISLNRQNKKLDDFDNKSVEGVHTISYTSEPLYETINSQTRSKYSEPLTYHLNKETQSIPSKPKNYFENLLRIESSSSIFVEASCDKQKYIDKMNNILEHGVRSMEQMDQTSLKDHKVKLKRVHGIETNFETENHRNESWENFTSKFDVMSHKDKCVVKMPLENRVSNHIQSNEIAKQQLDTTHSPSSLNEIPEQAVDQADSKRCFNESCGHTEMHLTNQSSNIVREKTTNCLECESRPREYSSYFEERELFEDDRHTESRNSSRNSTSADTWLHEGLETNSEESSLCLSSDFVNSYGCSDKTADPVMPYIPPRCESTDGAAEESLDLKIGKSDGSSQDGSANEFNTTNSSSRKNDDIKLTSEIDHCMTLSDCDSIRDHDQGIRDYLEHGEGLLKECVEQRRHSLEQIHVGNIQWRDNKSEKHDHLEAVYQLNENQEENTSEVGRVNAHRDDSDVIEQCDTFEFEKITQGISQQDETTSSSDMTSRKNNGPMIEQDFDAEKVSSTFSELNVVHTVTSGVDDDKSRIINSCEVSWPIDEAKFNEGAAVSMNKSVHLQRGLCTEQEIPREFETSSENSVIQPKAYSVQSQKYSKTMIDAIKYESSDMDSYSTEHLQYQNDDSHYQDSRHPGPIIRVLDRPLLDLDDGEYFDEIEIERQNTIDSWYQESDSRTSYSINTRNYRMDPRPDPLPDPSPGGGQRVLVTTPILNNMTEAPEGATKEELNLLNHFIDVASSNFGGNSLSAESESRVRSAALKVGLTSKFVDQLLYQTMKKKENPDSGLTFISPQQRPSSFELHQLSFHDQENNDKYNPLMHQHGGSNAVLNDYGGNDETYYTADYSRTIEKERRRHRSSTNDCNIWESLGKNLGFLASMTARTCGVKYHHGRDDDSSVVSTISWEDNNTGSPKARKSRSRRLRKGHERAEDSAPIYHNDEHHHDRSPQEEFATNSDVQGDRTGQESNVVGNITPPREKITQLV